MSEIAALLTKARTWAEHAQREGWLDDTRVAAVSAVEHATPADLFVDPQRRPLVVAFFGGTGVGKSSLLNRLAGEEVARTGPERPTSREVTVYVHESVRLAELPPALPVTALAVRRHRADRFQDVLWIDAPDIDSTEEENRRCALAWLPHVDLVCYVVSPERYRDDAGWQVLRARGHKHGWLFILNRWDEGDVRQCEDWMRLLRAAGFVDPVVVPTCCYPRPTRALPSPDQFEQIERTILELVRTHSVRELKRLEVQARATELKGALDNAARCLGDADAWGQAVAAARDVWRNTAMTIGNGLEWSLQAVAGRFGIGDHGWLEKLRRAAWRPGAHESPVSGGQAEPSALGELIGPLWDEWAQSKVGAALDIIEVHLQRRGLATAPARRLLDAAAQRAGAAVLRALSDSVRAALARPGPLWRRALRRITGFLMAFLPLLALLWVAYAAISGYYAAVRGQREFLGWPFAINSALVVVLAWAVPFTLDRLLRPSLERVVLVSLRQGLRAGLEDVWTDLEHALDVAAEEAGEFRRALDALQAEIERAVPSRTEQPSELMVRLTTGRPQAPGLRSA